MIDPILGALLLGGTAAAARASWMAWHHATDDGERVRRSHRRACDAILRQFLNTRGFLTGAVASRTEVASWIAQGISPSDLRRVLARRADAVPGPLMGYQASRDGRIPVRLPLNLRARHVYCVGRTGSGKTTLLRNFALQAMAAGEGMAVLAPEAELVHDELLPYIPEHRVEDVVVVDPADLRHPVGFNPLHLVDGEDLDLKAAELMSIFRRLCEEGTGAAPRMETILRQAFYCLLPLPQTTLLDIERLLDRQDGTFRRWVIDHTADEDSRVFWQSTYPSYPKDAHLSLVNRLGRFLRPRPVRTIVCAAESFDMRAAMDQGKIVLASLSDGLLGEENADLLGQLIVAKIQLAAMSRADVPQRERRYFSVIADEFQRFAGASASYESMLSRSRKYGVGNVLAHQTISQIPEHLMRGILGNVGTVVVFQVGATDARRLSRELVGEFDGEPLALEARELLGLRVGEAVCRVGRNVFRMTTLPPPAGGSARTRQRVLELSRRQFASQPVAPRITPLRTGTDNLDPGTVF